ncbi:hypothetical protein ATPR_0497 [Acetobacter tropicalis NBRC 101654]|uniref:Uncharacterized protein n=1 Tax=Acetobacter tropicalis NBRC 101654 TaxID=749388 RepID=F7VAU8_9PROT|nr:hypothetical protein ATPR_0497 [Acetobacter tropicalis NBRC 101654]
MEFFPGFEKGNELLGNLNLFPGFGVPANARVTFLDGKCAESTKLYAVIIGQTSGDGAKDSIDDQIDIFELKVRVFSHESSNELRFRHAYLPDSYDLIHY